MLLLNITHVHSVNNAAECNQVHSNKHSYISVVSQQMLHITVKYKSLQSAAAAGEE